VRGRINAAEMGRRRRDDGVAAVFTSDLRRAAETAEIASSSSMPSGSKIASLPMEPPVRR
jgi:broad specificity phosphatase PhoE